MKCKFCERDGDAIDVATRYVKGVHFNALRCVACPDHVTEAIELLVKNLMSEARDVPRRRAILELNLEYKSLIAAGAPQEELDANRAEKRALVHLRSGSTPDLERALKRVSNFQPSDRREAEGR